MKMISKLLLGGLIAAAAPAANAAVFVVGNVAYNFNVATTPYGQFATRTITFDTGDGSYQGYTVTPSSTGFGGVTSGNNPGQSAAPATSATTEDTTNYLAAKPNYVDLSNFGSQQFVSLYWGSIDGSMDGTSGNFLDFLDASGNLVGTVSGMQVGPPANGDQEAGATNRRVTIAADRAFTTLRFRTTLNAFEVDNISFLSAVPEPASWAMMVGGFGLMGAALRRKKSAQLFA